MKRMLCAMLIVTIVYAGCAPSTRLEPAQGGETLNEVEKMSML